MLGSVIVFYSKWCGNQLCLFGFVELSKFCVTVVEVRREERGGAEEWRELAEEAASMKCFFFKVVLFV